MPQSKAHYTEVRKIMLRRKARVTSKGQITIPWEVRQLLGVRPGDAVLFESNAKGVHVRPLREVSPFTKYRGIGNPGVSSGRKAIVEHVRKLRGR
jgi:AbrB family looped-hinge helix DNA binding protein